MKIFLRLSLCVLLLPTLLIGQQPISKVAFIVGVEKYEKSGFTNLEFAEDDAGDLEKSLKALGFDVILLRGSDSGPAKATRDGIARAFADRFLPRLAKLTKQDLVVVALAGHGQQQIHKGKEDAFFCPVDAHKSLAETWISISTLTAQVSEKSGSDNNLILIDACRDNPTRGRGVDGKNVELLRDNMAILFAASYGQQAQENDVLKHGLFTHHFLLGLRGEAQDTDGEVTWDNLVSLVKKRVTAASAGKQQPNEISNLRGTSPVLVSSVALKKSTPPVPKPQTPPKTITSRTTGMEFVLIPAGSFEMGSNETQAQLEAAGIKAPFDVADESPKHAVRISKPYYLGKHEVTVGQFRKFATATGHKTDAETDGKGGWGYNATTTSSEQKSDYNWRKTGFVQTDDHPVVNVSWNDATAFVKWIGQQDGREYRLPTEAEWEFACRGGSKTRYSSGDTTSSLQGFANVQDRSFNAKFPKVDLEKYPSVSFDDGYAFTSPAGSFKPNVFGIYDMHGNVYEWCADWYSSDYYATSAATDPSGPSTGSDRVLRGGSWISTAVVARSADRFGLTPGDRGHGLGFRVACSSVQ